MTQNKSELIAELMYQMDADLLDYAIDVLRHLKYAQVTLQNKDKGKLDAQESKLVRSSA